MNLLIIICTILIILLILILKFKYNLNIENISLVILGLISIMILIYFIFITIYHISPEKILIEERYGGTFDLSTISAVLPTRIMGDLVGLPMDLVYNLVYLFDPSSAIEASRIDVSRKKEELEKEIKKAESDVYIKETNIDGFSAITSDEQIRIADNFLKQSQKLYDFYLNNTREISQFSLTNYYDISIENDKLMILNPKKEFNSSPITKYVMMKTLHTSDFRVLEEYRNIKNENSYDFLFILAKEAPKENNIGHFVVVIVRKRNHEIKINLLDPLQQELRKDLVTSIRYGLMNFFGSDKNDNVIYINSYCGQQRAIDGSNCGYFSFKFIYNYLFLSYDVEDIDNDRVITIICPGRDGDSIPILFYNRFKTIWKGPANEDLPEEINNFTYKVGDSIKTKNFYYITTKEREFILKLIDVKFH